MCYEQTLPKEIRIPVTQDTVHLGGKTRNRILKEGIELPMGKHRVSIKHLKTLVKNVQKSVHGLSQSDVCPEDRMNFDSFQKITDDRVIVALAQNVENSEATIQYLKVCQGITSCFLELDLAPTDRIIRMYRGLYFLRIWRQYIKTSKTYTLKDNFITSNAYSCAEINARNLIYLMKKYRDEGAPQLFLPNLFDSQTCERTFRQFRALGTVNYTKINFSLHELLHMVGRIEVQNEISYFRLANEDVIFPNKRVGKTKIYSLPSDEEINNAISIAKHEAIQQADTFGMTNTDGIDTFDFKSRVEVCTNEDEESDEENCFEDLAVDVDGTNNNYEMYDGENMPLDEDLNENLPFVAINDQNGVRRIVRKSTLLWMLTEPCEKLSKDRLRRVQIGRKRRKSD